MKPDDSTLTPNGREAVRRHAGRLLDEASARGLFPTPVDRLVEAAGLRVAPESLDESLVGRFRRAASGVVKRALNKLMGLLHLGDRLIFLDRGLYPSKLLFIKLHETGHGWLPHQRDTYAILEECEHTLDPTVRDEFEREANVFASDVMFQLDQFTKDAADSAFGIRSVLALKKRYGSSIYAAMRRYATTHHEPVALIVLNPPEVLPGGGFTATLRRTAHSPAFIQRFGDVMWPTIINNDSPLGALVPIGRRMSGAMPIKIAAADGDLHAGSGEGFFSGHQVFILIRTTRDLRPTAIFLP